MIVRRARVEEADLLSELAIRSKSYWGYDNVFLEKATEDLTVTRESISSNHVYVLEDLSKVVGFFCLIVNDETKELDALFIDTEYIRKGYGRSIWPSILEIAKEIGIDEFRLISDPFAEGYYIKMGAVRIGEYTSTIFENRKLPIMKVIVK